jgi:hypothetical protein
MDEDDRILFDLRNELAQTIEIDGRTGLQKQLTLVQWMISKRARGGCPHIHAEDMPQIRAIFGTPPWVRTGWPSERYCGDHP